MRDPARIKLLLGFIEEVWTMHPDFAPRADCLQRGALQRARRHRSFYVEDSKLIEGFAIWLAHEKKAP